MTPAEAGTARPRQRAAVVVNPVKFDDPGKFRDTVTAVLAGHGWAEPLWLPTTPDDPGGGQVDQALRAGVALVLACGGDGTVTACGGAMAGRGVPMAIVPSGTGNLLARNLGIPLDQQAALDVAATGSDRRLDVGTVNGHRFLVMAGAGFDAKMLGGATEAQKRRLGWAAYALAALRYLGDRPMRVTLRADGGPPVRRRSSSVVIGNVGSLTAGIPLLPDARPDDGLLDAIVLTPGGLAGWLIVAVHVLTRRPSERVFRLTARKLQIDLDRPQPWELDGEIMGTARRLDMTVSPDELILRCPASPAGGAAAAGSGARPAGGCGG